MKGLFYFSRHEPGAGTTPSSEETSTGLFKGAQAKLEAAQVVERLGIVGTEIKKGLQVFRRLFNLSLKIISRCQIVTGVGEGSILLQGFFVKRNRLLNFALFQQTVCFDLQIECLRNGSLSISSMKKQEEKQASESDWDSKCLCHGQLP